jgi:hypothetical protein
VSGQAATGPPTRRVWTPAEVIALGVRTDVPTAGEILAGLCRDEAYRSVKRGDFPVPVVKVGRHLVVPVAPILELLGIKSDDQPPSGQASRDASFAIAPDSSSAGDVDAA